jgi:hypothetical protein
MHFGRAEVEVWKTEAILNEAFEMLSLGRKKKPGNPRSERR